MIQDKRMQDRTLVKTARLNDNVFKRAAHFFGLRIMRSIIY